MISARNLWKSYGSIAALRGATIDLESGINCIRGPNGSGKSTLMKILALLEIPDKGALFIFGHRITPQEWSRAEKLRGSIAYVPQSPDLFSVPVKSLVSICGKSTTLSWIEYFGLSKYISRSAAALSPGQRRRLQLAIAFSCVKKALLLDEPETYLDGEGRKLLAYALREISRDGVVIGYVSHGEPLVPCDRSYLIRDGAVVSE